ncbi:MAG: 4Fe-4S binding protein [Gammaproteobacteria bacterium]|nr:MAG: 4Fe-4S binding protein [Gammaproteobacteria bacterium]
MNSVQTQRLLWRAGFFILFILAPPLDIFRFDIPANHFVILGHAWTLGASDFAHGDKGVIPTASNMFLRGFLPVVSLIGIGIIIAWKWGRLYCGWLCPHFSVVAMINSLMRRASGKLSFWDKETLPELQCDGTQVKPNRIWWLAVGIAVLGFAFLWAVALLTYLLPPKEIYSNLIHGQLTPNQLRFIAVATILLTLEFTVARHLFCKYGCAVGIFQSLVWMGNKRGLVVGFDRSRAKSCSDCDASCEHACPMRLKPRSIKRKMFTCTQCMQCVEACEKVQEGGDQPSLLRMLDGHCALDVSDRDFGRRPDVPPDCFDCRKP